jgi:uncharacterized protein (DUF1697 family)
MKYVAFLRAINVGGHVVTMETLCELFREAGLKNPTSFIASGNVIFDSKATPDRKLEQKLERHLESALGYEVPTFVRSADEIAAIAAYKPPIAGTPLASLVGLMTSPLSDASTNALMALQTPTDIFHVHGRELYWLLHISQAKTKITNRLLERAIEGFVTFRNINTMKRLTKRLADHTS